MTMTSDELKELLGIWSLGPKGRALPQPGEYVRMRLGLLRPDEDQSALFGALRQNQWIDVLPNGDWTLTAAGLKARPADAAAPEVREESAAQREAAWKRFRVLCNYYADCVQSQEKAVETLFDNQHNTRFLLPSLPLGWMEEEKAFRVGASSAQEMALRHVANSTLDGREAFIGYPLHPFRTEKGNWGFTPLMLFPVKLTRKGTEFWAEIQRDEIDVNQNWLKYNLPPDEQRAALKCMIYSDGARRGLVDPMAAVAYFQGRFGVPVDPDRPDFDIWKRAVLLNSAALFAESELRFSRSLMRDLKRIREAPAEELEDVAFDFIPANTEQHEAVDEALNRPANKVTGPPGTGKSQVAVNLIANLVYRGRSVLFTSKNHKAIHAIHDKVDALNKNLPLVQFCSQSDGGQGAAWYSQDIDVQIGCLLRAQAELGGRGAGAELTVGDAADRWRDLKPKIREVEALRDAASAASAKLDVYRKGLERDGARPEAGLATAIGSMLRKWRSPLSKKAPWWRRLWDMWRKRKSKSPDSRERVRALLPGLVDEFASDETLKKRLERVKENLEGYFRETEQLDKVGREAAALPEYATADWKTAPSPAR